MGDLYALIMAGGRGTRLWPRSRESRPKQFLDIVSDRTMLQETYDRIEPLIPPEKMMVITNAAHVSTVQEQLPQVPQGNVIGELKGRGTAPAIGLGGLYLRRRDPDAVMIVQTADHVIQKEAEFRHALRDAAEIACDGRLVTLGIEPSHPDTGYGYIWRGERLKYAADYHAYRVREFKEKPDQATAESFVASGEYYWNSGMFIWKVSTILKEMQRMMPELHTQLTEIDTVLGTDGEQEVIERVWPQIESETIDFGVMEKADDIALLPVDIGWSDVGDWATLADLLVADKNGNVTRGEIVGIDTKNSLVHGSYDRRLIATVGIEDLVVVDTEDVLLVCHRDRAQTVKKLVEQLGQDETGRDYL